jgi:hypothetical protein
MVKAFLTYKTPLFEIFGNIFQAKLYEGLLRTNPCFNIPSSLVVITIQQLLAVLLGNRCPIVVA